ncbi:hypothetical protein C8F04DRAFT_42127 [Mycena alexandri]|uniref:F-box domain-containing protein n=1 Tax=Mycena alexandri TaxID=1745969 RepID=A0AAD6X205_9AGAR|nr:hypothetical protein C8F04DRAFT_42127 [Mycena alexandri]
MEDNCSNEEESYYSYPLNSNDEYHRTPNLATKEPSLAHLFASNDAPQPAQLAVLRQILRNNETTISKVESDISDVDSALEALTARRTALLHEKKILCFEKHQCRALTSPIRRLPPEIIGEIFIYFTPVLRFTRDYQSGNPDSPPKVAIPWYLGQICRYWRGIPLSLGFLWSIFDFRPGRRSRGLECTEKDTHWLLAAVESAKRRREQPGRQPDREYGLWSANEDATSYRFKGFHEAGGKDRDAELARRDLQVATTAENRRREHILALGSLELCLQRSGQGPFSSRLICHHYSRIIPLFEALCRSSHRLHHLTLVDLQEDLLHQFSQWNCKQLRRLELVFTTMTKFGPTFLWPPALTELALRNVYFDRDDIPWTQLSKYHEADCTWPYGPPDMRTRELRWAAYSQLTSMVELTIDFSNHLTPDNHPDDPVLLPKLERACFVFGNQRLFQFFDMPLLQNLTYSYLHDSWMEAIPHSATVNVPVPRSLSHLRTLRVRARSMDLPTIWSLGLGFRDILTRAPELTEIFIDVPCVSQSSSLRG